MNDEGLAELNVHSNVYTVIPILYPCLENSATGNAMIIGYEKFDE